jgi:hypothetical protein
MKKIALLTTALTLTFFGQTALSFGLPDMPAVPGVGATKSVEAGPLVAQLNEVLADLGHSEAKIQAAFGNSKEAADLDQKANSISSGKVTDEATIKVITDATKKSGAEMKAKTTPLSEESKKLMAQAIPLYAKAIGRSAGLAGLLTGAAQAITANPMSLVGGTFSAPELISVFTKSPDVIKQMVTTGYDLISFAPAQGLDVSSMKNAIDQAGAAKN